MTFPFPLFRPSRLVQISHTATATPTGSNLTTYDFGTLSLGTAASDRIMVVVTGASGVNTATLNAASTTIAGNAVTVYAEESNGTGSSNYNLAIAAVAVPTGTTGNLTVTWSAGKGRCLARLYAVYGGSLTGTDFANGGGADPTALAIDVASGGGVIGGITWNRATTNGTGSMTNLTNAVQDVVESVECASFYNTFIVPELNKDVTASTTGTGSLGGFASAAWSIPPA